ARKLQSLFRLEAGDEMIRLPQGITAGRGAGKQRTGGAGADDKLASVDAVLGGRVRLTRRGAVWFAAHNLICIIALLDLPLQIFFNELPGLVPVVRIHHPANFAAT